MSMQKKPKKEKKEKADKKQTIKNIISEVLKDSTVIIIAHRSTTIENVDKILKVQNKKVVIKSRKTIVHINNMEKLN